MQGSGACWPGLQGLGPGPAAEMLERRRERRLSWNCTAPPSETIQRPPRSADWGLWERFETRTHGFETQQEVKNLACRKSTGVSGGIQAPGACGPGLQGAWGPGLGARPTRGLGPFPHKNHHLSNYDFFANLLAGAWRRRGCLLKRLLRRWGPGGKRRPPLPRPPAFWGCKGERKRVFTLSAFGNHPTRPARSADLVTEASG